MLIISIFWMMKLRLRVALTEQRTAIFQAELWSQFRVGGHVDMSVERH